MNKTETVRDFYDQKSLVIPDNLFSETGHFNVFEIVPFLGNAARPVPYARRDFYKITLLEGGSAVEYADKVLEVKKQALIFTNPLIPYRIEHCHEVWQKGFFCIFNQSFFQQFGSLGQYSVFQPDGDHVYELTDEQLETMKNLYRRMLGEINGDYAHKYDVLRTLVYEVVHFALKMQPSAQFAKQPLNASQRIASLFLDLLERQFPIDENHRAVRMRTPSEFAEKLNIHTNHLNRVIKETMQKTTSQIIAERMLQESKVLLKQTSWTVSEIAYALGYSELTHFNNFFKKHLDTSPVKYRNI